MKIPTPTEGRCVWLRVGTLIDGVASDPLADAHVVYDKTGIRFVGGADGRPPRNLLAPAQTAPDADLPDATLLPGLIEAHAHLFLEGRLLDVEKRSQHFKKSDAELLAGARPRLEKLVRLGIAGVRDAGDRNGVGLALSRLYKSPDRPLMPYVDSPGAGIHREGRYGRFMSDPIEDHDSLEACVAARVALGADRIKLIATGIVDFNKCAVVAPPQMSAEEVAALVSAAKSFGRQTFAHASGDDGIENVLRGGVDSIEHGYFVRDDQLARMRDQDVAWVPTIAPVQKQIDLADLMGWSDEVVDNLRRIIDGHFASLRRANDMGVRIIAGSDAGSYGVGHGVDFFYELELMHEAGLPPIAVINAATGMSSDRLGYREPIGRIAPGYRSRFVVTEHSPLDSVSNLRKAKVVVFDGEVIEGVSEEDADGM